MRSRIRTTALVAALAAAAPLPAALAVGEGTSGIAVTDEGSATHGVTGQCAFGAILPGTSFEYIQVVYTASAHARGPAVSTSVVCTLRPAPGSTTSYGTIGITAPGPEALVAGIADVPRRLPELYGCVTANAAFVDGSVAANRPVERCEKL